MKPKRPKQSESAPPSATPKIPEPPKPWWIYFAIIVPLLLTNLALYHRTIDLGFLSVDDPDYVQNNPYIENFSGTNLNFIFTQPYAANYAPANLLSYALDVKLAGGKKPQAVHLSSVMWHGWVVCMVYFLALTIRAEIFTAAAAALLFMLHPAHVEVVAWISSRKDLVATGFAALSMACYLMARKSSRLASVSPLPIHFSLPHKCGVPASFGTPHLCGSGMRACWYTASVLSFLVASAGKQSVLLLPVVMLAWDLLVEKRRSWKMIADKIPFGLITLFFGWMTWHAQPSTNQSPNLFVLAATELTNLWLLTGLGKYVLYRPTPDPAAWSHIGRIILILVAALVWALPLLLLWKRKPIAEHNRPTPSERSAVQASLYYWILVQMVPPMLLSFIVPITDRYLFLPSVGICILLAHVFASLKRRWLGWMLLAGLALVWGLKTSNYVNEWCDPRSVWYGAHLKTKNSQVSQFLGEIYQNTGDRVDGFVKTGTAPSLTNDIKLAHAVLEDQARAAQLETEWRGIIPTRTNSVAYRDLLWKLAWDQYQDSAAHRGKLSTPNLFMNRGRLLVSQGKFAQAVPEFQIALAFAQHSSYEVVRQETVIHALRGIGTAYWHLRNYKEAQPWFLKAQEVQRKSGKLWVGTLDVEVERVKALAASQR